MNNLLVLSLMIIKPGERSSFLSAGG